MATLVSLNVGLPKDVAWKGRTVHTGAWKQPVDGPRMVRSGNIDGDGQGDLGGHGGENRAVLVYQIDSYRYWAAELGRDDLAPGHFGENFTVDGLPDDEVCVGDRYRIGDAEFEVTQPRVTCYRVGMRMSVPNMASLLVSHHRPGFYLRVLTEGEVAAGQEIVKVASGPEAVTVAKIDALLYLPGHSRDALDRALRIPALSPGWKTSLENLAKQATATGNTGLTGAASSPPPAWTGFRPLAITALHDESGYVRSLSLADPAGGRLPGWLPGQSITVRLRPDDGEPTVIRNYSLSNVPDSGDYRIGVKREPNGRGSGYLHARVAIGDVLDVAAPRGTFFLADGERPVILLSAGVGITPVLSMLHALAESGSTREVWWLHGARNGSEDPFAAESRELLNRLPGSHCHVFYSRPSASDGVGVDFTAPGRLSVDALRALGLPRDAEAYLCGPADFMATLSAGLAAYGLDVAHIHSETFGATAALTPGIAATPSVPPHQPSGPAGSGPDVGFARSGLTVPWGPPYDNLLEFAEACDVPTRWSCRTGVCHNCETALLSGSVRYDPEPLEPPADGNVLICCSTPADAVVLDL
ncbi:MULTISPECIES: MOSC and FAD-binding oxidoreductase domain-containing protein [unclassified Mycobacterium]|uniref:MOSC and FAD-binding oxidoreductase domain-containing protein n=1 Tax=unclassified Mycobacterium TaxID=2642494 RepID=UPI0029C8EA80|nr:MULTISPECIES: MOSC and FAD-binding oxidoreductase domain-containing protein [unclassified Mycobacterium]